MVALWNSNTSQPGGLEFEVMDMLYGLDFRDWMELDKGGPQGTGAQRAGRTASGTAGRVSWLRAWANLCYWRAGRDRSGRQRVEAARAGRHPPNVGANAMSAESERAFHLERAEQCRKMAEEAVDPAVRSLHEQLAEFHEAEAQRTLAELEIDPDLT